MSHILRCFALPVGQPQKKSNRLKYVLKSEEFAWLFNYRIVLPLLNYCALLFQLSLCSFLHPYYSVVDGFFVSNYVGKTSFSAVNFIMPILLMLGALGFMFGTGGSALIAKTMGEGDTENPNRIFSFLVYVSLVCGMVVAALGLIFLRPFAATIGAGGALLEESIRYGRIVILAIPAFVLQFEFQSLFVRRPAIKSQ